MRFELFIALRYLVTRRKQSFISIISLVSVLGVGLGVAALIVVIGVMNGFSTDLRDKILGVNAHVLVMSLEGNIRDHKALAEEVKKVPGVAGVTPFIYSEVMLSNPLGVKGIVLRGIDPDTASSVLSLDGNLIEGSLANLKQEGMPRIIIGRELARRLALSVGDRVNLLSPAGNKSAAGFSPEVKIFKIAGVFATGMYEYDTTLTYVTLQSAMDMLGYTEPSVTGLEVRAKDMENADVLGKLIKEYLGPPYYARDWKEMNANLFAALKLEKTAMFIILTMIVLVGSFSIITTLVMLVMEKTRDIAVLMSMGATRQNIRRVFVYQGVVIGFVGTALGYALGLTAGLLLKKYQFIKLPEDVYSMDHLPVRFEWFDLTLIGVAALALCFLATLYPARQASRLNPVEALRFE